MADVADQVTETILDQGAGGESNPEPSADTPAGWISGLPNELKEHEGVKGFKTVGEFAQDAVQVKADHADLKTKMEGAIFKPGEDATEEDKTAFRTALGVPETAEGYKFSAGEGVEHSKDMTTWFAQEALKAGLTAEQADSVVQSWDGLAKAQNEANVKAVEAAKSEATDTLKKEWGADYDKNVEFTRRGFDHFLGVDEETKGFLDKGGKGNHPLLIKLFHKVGVAMGEDWSPPGTHDGSTTADPTNVMKYKDMEQFAD
jgi:hypothetical protein